MYLFGTTFTLSFVVSASMIYSDFTLPDDWNSEPTSLPFDQTALLSHRLSLSFDQTTPLLDTESDGELASTDAVTALDLPWNPDYPSSDMIWDGSFEFADCTTSESSLPAIGKSRARRADDSSSCTNPDHSDGGEVWRMFESLDKQEFSISCTLLTAGLLPVAVAASHEAADVQVNLDVLNSVSIFYRAPRLYYPTTLYRARLSTEKASHFRVSRFDRC